ncbi:MAG: hypothetical protein EOP84_36350, partial [Verrucomicrobiaceae bacterium]
MVKHSRTRLQAALAAMGQDLKDFSFVGLNVRARDDPGSCLCQQEIFHDNTVKNEITGELFSV